MWEELGDFNIVDETTFKFLSYLGRAGRISFSFLGFSLWQDESKRLIILEMSYGFDQLMFLSLRMVMAELNTFLLYSAYILS